MVVRTHVCRPVVIIAKFCAQIRTYICIYHRLKVYCYNRIAFSKIPRSNKFIHLFMSMFVDVYTQYAYEVLITRNLLKLEFS